MRSEKAFKFAFRRPPSRSENMPEDRSIILQDALKVSRSEVRWHFIADYYDGPISGLAFFRDRLYRFCCFPEDIPEQHVYVLQELTPEERAEALRRKANFEEYVGTHWSFDNEGKPLPHIIRPHTLNKRFYDEEKPCRPDLRDRPVVAWFDIAE
jgi:hypothetical protein